MANPTESPRNGLRSLVSAVSPCKLVGAAARTGGFAVASAVRAVHPRREFPEVPVPRPSLARLAVVFAEELMLMSAAIADPRLRDDDALHEISVELDYALAHLAVNGWLEDPAAYHQDPSAPTTFELEPAAFGRLRYQLLSFDSGYTPRPGMPGGKHYLSSEANHRCYAYVMEHRDGPRPWLVYVHGFGMGSPFDLLMMPALMYFRDLGFNVLAPVLPLHGPRRHHGPNRVDLLSLDWVSNVHSVTQMVWDIRRCLAWIRERDAVSIAVHGMSLGGYATALVAGLDPDLDCVIAGVPSSTVHHPLVAAYGRSPEMRKSLERHDLLGDRVDTLHRVVTPTSFPCLVPRNHRFIYAGTADRLVTPNQPYLLWEHWDRPSIEWSQHSHMLTMTSSAVRRFVRDAVIESSTRSGRTGDV